MYFYNVRLVDDEEFVNDHQFNIPVATKITIIIAASMVIENK
jgi:hypothetical protein